MSIEVEYLAATDEGEYIGRDFYRTLENGDILDVDRGVAMSPGAAWLRGRALISAARDAGFVSSTGS